MSTRTKWLIGILVVVVIVAAIAWYSALSSHASMPAGAPQQAAAVATAMAPTSTAAITANGTAAGNPAINAVTILTTQIDQGIQANATDFASQSSGVSLAAEVRIAGRIGTINSQMLSATASLQSLISSAKAAGRSTVAAQAAYSDMQKNISGATTILVAANKAIAAINPSKTTTSASALSAILTQLTSAESYVQSARADIQVIVKA